MLKVEFPVTLKSILDAHLATAAVAISAGMQRTGRDLEKALEKDSAAAGLGKLSRAWQSQVYPPGKPSLGAAAIVYPRGAKNGRTDKAFGIFETGGTIKALGTNGNKLLAIPTDNVPFKIGAQGQRSRMSPVEVEAAFNADLVIRPDRKRLGVFIAYIPAAVSKSRRGFRRPAARSRSAVTLIAMFVLTPSATIAKRLNIAGRVAEAQAKAAQNIADELR